MDKKPNGSHTNGSGRPPPEDDKIVRLPSLAERDRMRKEKIKQEKQQSPKSGKEPFLNLGNIPPFTGLLTLTIIAVHVVVFMVLSYSMRLNVFYTLGFVPGYFTGTVTPWTWLAPLGIVAHVFLHGSWMHLAMNATMALTMGMFFEKAFGARATMNFFFLCCLAGAALHFAFAPFSTVPMIGASAGISGLFAAVLMMLYQAGQVGALGSRGPFPFLAFWLIFTIVVGVATGAAWQAHVGGFLAGIVLLNLLQKRKIRL